MTTSEQSSLVVPAAIAAASVGIAAAVSLTVLQSDAFGRLILKPTSLRHRRQSEYQYRWATALAKAALQFRYALNGGMIPNASDVELLQTNFLHTEQDLALLSQRFVDKDLSVRVARIGSDSRQNNQEYYVWLVSNTTSEMYQLPLTRFCQQLAKVLERKISTTTFCFVSDASAGVATDLLLELLTATKSSAYVLKDPLWMVCLAVIAESRVLSKDLIEQILMALCRLEALQTKESTVVIALPCSVTPILMALLQSVFPDDRHVFAYTGCVNTVQYATHRRALYPRAHIPNHVDKALGFQNPVGYTTPLTKSLHKSANVMTPFTLALAKMPISHADAVETWMASADGFLALKEEEKLNNFLPYVFRLDYLFTSEKLERGTARYWSVRSLLQFVTGSKSRELSPETMDAAISVLSDYTLPYSVSLSLAEQQAIENAVFQHKLILIESKILKDTVQPAEHWTLKAAMKRGCACCLPEEDEEEETITTLAADSTMSLSPKTASRANGGYVDGKTTFAFDPSRFS